MVGTKAYTRKRCGVVDAELDSVIGREPYLFVGRKMMGVRDR